MPRPLASLVIGAGLFAAPALAAWAPQGNPLSNMPGHQYGAVAARYLFHGGTGFADGNGMLVVWIDIRNDGGDLYYSIVSDAPRPDPAPGTDGFPVVVGTGSQFAPAVAAVASPMMFGPGSQRSPSSEASSPAGARLPAQFSPVVVAWTDWPSAEVPMQVRAKRIGDIEWGATGVPVHDVGTTGGADAAVSADGDFGAVVVWTERAVGLRATRAQRLDFTGARLWGADGVALGTDTTVSSRPQAAVVPSDGAYVLRLDRRNGTLTGIDRALALFRVDGSGALGAGWPAEGLLLGDNTVSSHRLLADGNGGAYVIWQQSEILSNDAIGRGVRMTRILADGSAAPGWSLAGTNVALRADGHVRLGSADVRPDGGVVLALSYEQVVGGPSATGVDLVAQRMLPDGQRAPGWPATGMDLCVAPGEQHGEQVIASGEGLLAVWSDARGTGVDLFGVKLASDGSPASGWTANGQVLCDAPSEQIEIVLAPATGGGAVFAWRDERDFPVTQTDVYAQTVNAIGQVEVPFEPSGALSLSHGWPQPASSSARFALSGSEGEAQVEVLDLQGRAVNSWTSRVSAASRTLVWDLSDRDGRRVAPGIYHLRVRLGPAMSARRVVVVR